MLSDTPAPPADRADLTRPLPLHRLQVTIKSPSSEDYSYLNRKGYHSIGCQLVCNSRGLLLSAETNWPGSFKDTEILEKSALYQQLQEVEEGWLLGEASCQGRWTEVKEAERGCKMFLCQFGSTSPPGDCRYPLRKWLMTPVDEPQSSAELQYNMAHVATHEIVDRTFRAIQTRFRCLDGTKGYLQVSRLRLCLF